MIDLNKSEFTIDYGRLDILLLSHFSVLVKTFYQFFIICITAQQNSLADLLFHPF